jgi:hypothetical protein
VEFISADSPFLRPSNGGNTAGVTTTPNAMTRATASGGIAVDVTLEAGTWRSALFAALPTVANHLVFEADARIVRGEAQRILADPALLPTVNRAGYEQMLNDFIVVTNLLQPGPDYGTTAQDDAAWAVAMNASNIDDS